MPSTFRQQLLDLVSAQKHPVCIGIDPHRPATNSFLHSESVRRSPKDFLKLFSKYALEGTKEFCKVVKFQSAFFEQYGPAGIEALQDAIHFAKSLGFFVILDAKRGDISSTMEAYGRMAFDVMNADCLTVTPWMGWDVVSPLKPWLLAGKGIFLVWLTSNRSAAEVQEAGDSLLRKSAALFLVNAEREGLLESLGFVVGATKIDVFPKHFPDFAMKSKTHRVPLLMPGVGAQGATFGTAMQHAIQSFAGSLVPLSRGITESSTYSPRDWDEFAGVCRANMESQIALFHEAL